MLGGKGSRLKDCLWINVYWVPLPGASMKSSEMHQYMLSSNRAIPGSKEYKLIGLVVHFPLRVYCRSLHQGPHTESHTKSSCSRSQKHDLHLLELLLLLIIAQDEQINRIWVLHQVLCRRRNSLFKILLKVSAGDKAQDRTESKATIQVHVRFRKQRQAHLHLPYTTLYISQDCWPLHEMK